MISAKPSSKKEVIQIALDIILKVKGIQIADLLPQDWRNKILLIEESLRQIAKKTKPSFNKGVKEVLEQEVVIVALHNPELEHPDMPTIILSSSDLVIGEEIWRKEELEKFKTNANVILIGESFVVYKDRINQCKGKPSEFVLPPISPKWLKGISGISKALSASPSASADFAIRKMMGWNCSDPNLGTILIGIDLE